MAEDLSPPASGGGDGEPVARGSAAPDPLAEESMVEMRDGVRIATDVYLPEPARRRVPTVLVRMPYDKSSRYTMMPAIARYLIAHGFATVVQDVRGKFRSEGKPEPFVNEARDGLDTLDWIADQAWSDGTVGMFGDSYYGFTQWAAAASGHHALRAIVPRGTGTSILVGNHPENVPRIGLLENVLRNFSTSGKFETRPLSSRPVGAFAELPSPYRDGVKRAEALVAGSKSGELWSRCFPAGPPAAGLRIPALHVGGWFDLLQKPQLADWAECSRLAPAAEHQFLRMRPTDHEDQRLIENRGEVPDAAADEDALGIYLSQMLDEPLSFLEHYLSGRDRRWQAPRVVYDVAYGGSEVVDRWPPERTERLSLELVSAKGADGGALRPTRSDARREAGSELNWLHDPFDPVPYPFDWEWGMLSGLPDESPLHRRADVNTFDGEPVDHALDLLGPAGISVTIGADSPSTHVIVRLLDVAPEGDAAFMLEGAALVRCAAGPERVRVHLGDTAYRLRPGHRLRLAISTSSFPQYMVHPGTDESPLTAVDARPAEQRLIVGGADGARLDLLVRRPYGD